MRTPDVFRPALKKYPVLRKGFSRYYAPLTLAPAEGQTAGNFRPAGGFAVEIRDRALTLLCLDGRNPGGVYTQF